MVLAGVHGQVEQPKSPNDWITQMPMINCYVDPH